MSDKWIQKARPENDPDRGALRRHFGLKKDEKLSISMINKELKKLQQKAKGDKKLSPSELKLLKRLSLARNLMRMDKKSSLKKKVLRLAHEKPELRKHLMRALKNASEVPTFRVDFEVDGMKSSTPYSGMEFEQLLRAIRRDQRRNKFPSAWWPSSFSSPSSFKATADAEDPEDMTTYSITIQREDGEPMTPFKFKKLTEFFESSY